MLNKNRAHGSFCGFNWSLLYMCCLVLNNIHVLVPVGKLEIAALKPEGPTGI